MVRTNTKNTQTRNTQSKPQLRNAPTRNTPTKSVNPVKKAAQPAPEKKVPVSRNGKGPGMPDKTPEKAIGRKKAPLLRQTGTRVPGNTQMPEGKVPGGRSRMPGAVPGRRKIAVPVPLRDKPMISQNLTFVGKKPPTNAEGYER